MEKWYQEEYTWTVEVIGYLRGNTPEGYCRNGEEIGDRYTCTYGCPVNQAGQGICSKVMGTLFPLMEAVRSGGDLRNVGGSGKYTKDVVCPDGCVIWEKILLFRVVLSTMTPFCAVLKKLPVSTQPVRTLPESWVLSVPH